MARRESSVDQDHAIPKADNEHSNSTEADVSHLCRIALRLDEVRFCRSRDGGGVLPNVLVVSLEDLDEVYGGN